uniref:Uncharacterized protein n=1 Tax=Cacopsylla melanoneura TaxID=428564 RepID=A0A8D9AMG8_9HEMI
MSERHITLIGEHEVKISILNQLVEHSGNEEISSLEDCFISKFGHTIQDLLKPTRSVKFSVIVNPNYEFYKQLSDRFTDKAYYPDGLSELFARRKKCMQERKTVSIDNFNNNSDDSNKTIRKTDKSKRSFSNYRTEPKEDSQDSNEKLDRECEDHVCIDHCRLSSNEEDSRQDFEMVVDQDEKSLSDTFNNSVNLEPAVYSSSNKFGYYISGSTMIKNQEALSNNKGKIAVPILDQNGGNKDLEILDSTDEEKNSQGNTNIIDQDRMDMTKEVRTFNKEYGHEDVDRDLPVQNVLNKDVEFKESIENDSLIEIPNKQTMDINIEVKISTEKDRQEEIGTKQDSGSVVQTVRPSNDCHVTVPLSSRNEPTPDTAKVQEILNNPQKGMNNFFNPINPQPKISDINDLGTKFSLTSREQSSITLLCDNSVTVCDESSQHPSNCSRYWNDWTCMYKRGRLDRSNLPVLIRANQEDYSEESLGTLGKTPYSSIECPRESSLKENSSRGDMVYETLNKCVLDVNSKILKANNDLNFDTKGMEILNPKVKVMDIEVPGKETHVETDIIHIDNMSVKPLVSVGLDITSEETDLLLTVNSKVDDMNMETKDISRTDVSQSEHSVHVDKESLVHGQTLNNVVDQTVSVNIAVPLHPLNNVSKLPDYDSDEIEIIFENITSLLPSPEKKPLLPSPEKSPLLPSPEKSPLLPSLEKRSLLPSPSSPDLILEKIGRNNIGPSHDSSILGRASIDVGPGLFHDSSILGRAPIDVVPHDQSILGRSIITGEPSIEPSYESRIVSRGTTHVGPTHDNISLVTHSVKLLNDTTWTDSRHSLTNQDRPFTISSPENQIQIQPYATFLISPSKRVHSTSDNETILSPGKYGDVRETAANDVRRLITAKRRARKGEEFLSWIFIPLDVPVKAVDRRPLKASRSSHGQPKSKRVRFSETIESDATENAPLPPLPPPEDVPHPPPPPLDVADIDETSLVRGVTDCPVETVPQEGRDENFISSNMDENQDNFNPEWSEVANIYNTQRYDLIQRRWDTNDVANPKRNLTIVQYKTRSRHRRRTEPIVLYDRSSGNDEDEPLPKRSRMESCTYMFDKLIEEVNNRIERVKLKFATRKREALAMLKRTQLRQLENRPNKYLSMQQHRQELRRFNVDSALRLQNILNPFKSRVQKLNALREDLIHFYNFYRGLSKANELALHLTPEEAEDILSIEATISGYRDCYGDAR